MTIDIDVVASTPRNVDVVGVPVFAGGPVPRQLGMSRARLAELGFEAKAGQTLSCPGGSGPLLVAVGLGDPKAAHQRRPALGRGVAGASRGHPPEPRHHAGRPRPRRGRGRGGGAGGGRGRRPRLLPLHGVQDRAAQGRRWSGWSWRSGAAIATRCRPGWGEGAPSRRPWRWRVTWPTPHPTTSTPSTWPSGPSPSRPSASWPSRCSTRRTWPSWGWAGCSASTGARPSRPDWSSSTYTPRRPTGHGGAGRQGRDVRLGRHLPQALRRHARADEDGHDGRGRGAGHHVARCLRSSPR